MTAARHPFAVELRALLAIAAPLAAANVAQMLMGLTSTIMVGHLGSAALASAGLGGSLYFTLVIVCRSVLAAVAPLAAHAIGADEHHEAGLLAGTGLVMAGIIAMPIIVVLRLLGPLLGAIGYSPVLAAGVGEYLSAVCWGAPAFLAFEVLRALLAATSRARAVMLAVVLAIPANALLGWTFIFGHLRMPALGIVGAGYATATIQWSMALGLTLLLLTLPRQTTLRLPRQIAQRVRAILRLGLPIGGLIALEVGVFAVAGILMGLFGADALAAHQLALNVASLTFMIPLGISQAATVRVAFELGASAPRVAHRAGVVALLVGVIIMMACGLLIWMAPRAIAGTIKHAETSLRLSPHARVGTSLVTVGAAHFFSRRFEEAVPKLLLAIQQDPSMPLPYRHLAAYAHMGRLDDARETLRRLQAITPVVLPSIAPYRNPEHRELYLSGLRLAAGEAI